MVRDDERPVHPQQINEILVDRKQLVSVQVNVLLKRLPLICIKRMIKRYSSARV